MSPSMNQIHTFPFNIAKFDQLKTYHFGQNWPVVYIIEDSKEMYIGETINVYNRSKSHYEKDYRKKLKTIHVLGDEEFNKSATLDIESWLIQYMSADGQYKLQNGNGGIRDHRYYDKEKYKAKFEVIWDKLRELNLAKKSLVEIRNTDLFKYSPYKALTNEQFQVVEDLVQVITTKETSTNITNGKPGTGKTIVATYLVKYLLEQEKTKDLMIGLVIPMTSLRSTLKRVFRGIHGLKPSMVIGPNDVTKEDYDVLIVDESHRLKRRQSITNYKSFDDTNKLLGLGNEGTELDWIMMSSKHQIFFYDENQSVRPADLPPKYFNDLGATRHDLITQMRVEGGNEYVKYIDDIFDLASPDPQTFDNYQFKLYDDIREMKSFIEEKDKEIGLCRLVAGYAWSWATKTDKTGFDIDIDGVQMIWNTTAKDWVNSSNAINEVGCIHTVQGYDLNHVGVIIGPELSYDFETGLFIVDKNKYKDRNGHQGADQEELERYVINIYKTLLTRAIRGTHVYVVDDNLRRYFKQFL